MIPIFLASLLLAEKSAGDQAVIFLPDDGADAKKRAIIRLINPKNM